MCEYFDKAISYTGILAIVRTNCSNIRNPTGMQFIDSYVHAHADRCLVVQVKIYYGMPNFIARSEVPITLQAV